MTTSHDIEAQLTYYDYEQVSKRPNFKTEIDTSRHQIEALIAECHFPERHPCGKKGCHQPHNHGWLAITTDNQETLIGSKCGLEWGGESFTIHKTSLKKRIQRDSQLKAFYETIRNSDSLLDRVNEIKTRPRGANWISGALKKLEDSCTIELLRDIKSRALRGEATVSKDVLKSKEERDIEDSKNEGSRVSAYKTEVIGTLIGLEVFNYDLREILMDKVYSKILSMRRTDPQMLSTPSLNTLMNDAGLFEALLNQAEDILKLGNKFFSTTDNFKLIKTLDKRGKHNHLTKINWFDNL